MTSTLSFKKRSPLSVAAIALVAIVVLLLLSLPALRFLSLHSNFYDLGQYATYHYSIAFNGYWGSVMRTHAHLLTAPYALLYRVLPSNLTLLMMQSGIVVATTTLWVAYWIRLKLPSPAAGALLYLLSISVWFCALFEFHFEHLVFPLLFGFYLVIEISDQGWAKALAILLGLLLCMVKEVYPLSAAMLGLYLVVGKRWLFTGLALLFISLIYFFVITRIAIPYFSDAAETGELWKSAFGYLGASSTDMIVSIVTDPLTLAIDILSTPRKWLYVVGLFGALAFLPLFRPLLLLPALPVLGISLLSHNANHYYLGHQYTVAVTAMLLLAAAQALTAWRPAAQRRWIAALLVATVASQIAFGPSPFSRLFWSPDIFSYHWTAYRLDQHDRLLKQAIAQFIPQDDRIAVAAQNAINSDRLTNRSMAFAYPAGIFAPQPIEDQSDGMRRTVLVDYVVIDRKRPLSFGDDICIYDRIKVCDDAAFIERFNVSLDRLAKDFTVLYDHDGVLIAKRNGSR